MNSVFDSYFFLLRTYGQRQHELRLDKQSSQQGKNSPQLTRSRLESLGFAEEVQEQKQRTTWRPFPFVIDRANTFCGAPPLAHKTWKQQSPDQNSGNKRPFVGPLEATELLPAWRKWQNETCDVWWPYLCYGFTPHSLTQFTLLSVAGGEKAEPQPLMFVCQ